MSEVRLVIREAERDWSGTIHGSFADRAIAALSADPVTLKELETACGRYAKLHPEYPFFGNFRLGTNDESYDAGLVVIDLVARLVVVDSTYSSPDAKGEVCYHDGQHATDTHVRYHLADDWLFLRDGLDWQAHADERRRKFAARPPLDARAVLYGKPLLEFIARETFAAFHRQPETAESSTEEPTGEPTDDDRQRAERDRVYTKLKDIHAAWLLTPRDDLGGHCPRDVMLAQLEHIDWDLQHQSERWSALCESPPGIGPASFAFRYGGFGTHELVTYYELERELLASCWERLEALGPQPATTAPPTLMVGDFLTTQVPCLEVVREQWLDSPDSEFHGRTPRSIIERERTRLPEAMSGRDHVVDPDCPCCQMLADMPGVGFWHLDGCNMDDDFAFDIRHRTREEWEAEQREWAEHSKRFNEEWAERERLGVTQSKWGESGKGSVWSSSFSASDDANADAPLSVRIFGVGVHLAELIVDLRRSPANVLSTAPLVQPSIDALNRDFGNLREILQSSDPATAAALYQPVIDRFAESLSAVASEHPDLSAKCEALTNMVTRLLEPHSVESTWDSDDFYDDETSDENEPF